MATVTFTNVSKSYGQTQIVKDLNLELPDGSLTVLVGPSGCGKSTSLRMLAGLEPITSGEIAIGDRLVTRLEPKDRDIAMVFQNYALYPHLTVRENIAFPLRATREPRAEALKRADAVAESLGLTHLLARKPKDLSGGQQQRVAIGRAIIRQPSVFLFDEPLSNLDAKLRVETRTELLQIQRRLSITSLYVTHDQEEAMTLSDRMVVMKEGRIAQQGTPLEVYSAPGNTFVAAFVGSPKMNLIDGALERGVFVAENGLRLELGADRPDGPLTLGVRPDDLLVEAAASGSSSGSGATGSTSSTATRTSTATVGLVELLGPRAIVSLDAAGIPLTSVVEASSLVGVHEASIVELRVRRGTWHLFDRASGERLNG
jgi:multiple sugar transport system ATP-binding protein